MLHRCTNGVKCGIQDGNSVTAVDPHSNPITDEADALVESLLVSVMPYAVLSCILVRYSQIVEGVSFDARTRPFSTRISARPRVDPRPSLMPECPDVAPAVGILMWMFDS